MVEDRGWYKEEARGDSWTESSRRPRVYSNVRVKSDWKILPIECVPPPSMLYIDVTCPHHIVVCRCAEKLDRTCPLTLSLRKKETLSRPLRCPVSLDHWVIKRVSRCRCLNLVICVRLLLLQRINREFILLSAEFSQPVFGT